VLLQEKDKAKVHEMEKRITAWLQNYQASDTMLSDVIVVAVVRGC
jgi:hypothetical protein